MANRRPDPVSYRPFRTQPLLADGLLAVARPGGEFMSRVSAGLARLADEAGAIADQKAARAGQRAGERDALTGRPRLGVEGGAAGAPGGGDDENALAAELLRKEEGFRDKPYWDVNALRTGYGSDTVTLADGTVKKVEKGTVVSRADAERDLARRLADVEGKRAVGQVGADNWAKLPAATRAALKSVAYNYGSLPKSVVAAVKSGGDIAGAVEGLSANRERRKREADIIRGAASAAPSAGATGAPATVTSGGGGFRPSGRDTVYGRAYDEAGAKTYVQMLETEMRSTAGQLFEKYRSDPAGLQNAFGTLSAVLKRDHVFAEIEADFEAGFGRLTGQYLEQARENLAKDIETRDRGLFAERESAMKTDIARQIAAFDPATDSATEAIAASTATLEAHYDLAADKGLITPEAAVTAKANARRDAATAYYLKQAGAKDASGVDTMRAEIQRDFAAGGGEGLDANGWFNLDTQLGALAKSKRAAAEEAGKGLVSKGKNIADRIVAGFAPDPVELAAFEQAASQVPGGEVMVAATRERIAAATVLRDLPLADARTYVADMRARVGENPTDAEVAALTFAEGALKSIETRVERDALGYAQQVGRIKLEPIDTSDPARLDATLALRRAQARAVADLYGVPVMLFQPAEAKALKAAIGSADPRRFADAMTQLDALSAEGSIDDVRRAFGEKAADQLQDWQGTLRYTNEAELATALKERADPKWQERVKPLVTKGEKEAREVPFEDIVSALDTNWLLDAGAPLDADSRRMIIGDYVSIYGQRYAATGGDAETARAQTVDRMRRVWGVTSVLNRGSSATAVDLAIGVATMGVLSPDAGVRGGRLMAYPPERNYPRVAFSHDWMGEQLAAFAAERGVALDNISLVADGETKLASDRNIGPGYLLSVVDPATGYDELLTDDAGAPLRWFFDPAAARADAMKRGVQADEDAIVKTRDQALDEFLDGPFGPFHPTPREKN